jgi:hypothetical protein
MHVIQVTCEQVKAGTYRVGLNTFRLYEIRLYFGTKYEWIEIGRKNGLFTDSMRRAREANNYDIRHNKKDEDTTVRKWITDALINNGEHNFWAEIKGMSDNNVGTNKTVKTVFRMLKISQNYLLSSCVLYFLALLKKEELHSLTDDLDTRRLAL